MSFLLLGTASQWNAVLKEMYAPDLPYYIANSQLYFYMGGSILEYEE